MLPHGRSTRFVSARTEYRAIPAKFKPMRPMCVRKGAAGRHAGGGDGGRRDRAGGAAARQCAFACGHRRDRQPHCQGGAAAAEGSYGTIRMHQEIAYKRRVHGTDLKNPDFAKWGRELRRLGPHRRQHRGGAVVVERALTYAGPGGGGREDRGGAHRAVRDHRPAVGTRLRACSIVPGRGRLPGRSLREGRSSLRVSFARHSVTDPT
jgi:hypothetical protein